MRIWIARKERGRDYENFGTGITIFRDTVEKVRRFEVSRNLEIVFALEKHGPGL
jgi:hypothetical protein